MAVDTTLYELLEVEVNASSDDIRKAYKRHALANHPDKVPETERATASVRFQKIQQAYDILRDPQSRSQYDQYGLDEKGQPAMEEAGFMEMDDLLSQMFGMPMGGGPGKFAARERKRRGSDVIHEYPISLEDMYTGREIKLAATRDVTCSGCQGTGGKRFAKERTCVACQGRGYQHHIRQVQGHYLTNQQVICPKCSGKGVAFREKDRCKRCKGKGVTDQRRILVFNVPPGSHDGDKIVQPGMADEALGMVPGDVILVLREKDHNVFERLGDDLMATVEISLAEALCGFSRVLITTLDGRALRYTQPAGKILRPGDCIVVSNEGMPKGRYIDVRGDLYLKVDILFPPDYFYQQPDVARKLAQLLPRAPHVSVSANTLIDDVEGRIGDKTQFGGEARFASHTEEEEYYSGNSQSVPECTAQ
ncbi:DNAJ protein Xdj1 [Schizosaccharomyces japonicus yFS275]|uniref:DNAJ protein Xdj1 n=1 Tax=Schizosaccharomyces japonicus (strain yFS275 / FY16936) TaxID=402676 RepID=B6K3F1_SCHJY|nr:DNAJ protein Xdj1 [Schizosaccharomyces japonicus yFS275]EEB08008.1 DNAJ protein Xdj1 [Schizosaccharomyces japonicus yFS275]